MSRLQQFASVLLTTAIIGWFASALPVFAQDYIPLAPIEVAGMQDADKFTRCTPSTTYKSDGTVLKEADCLPKYLTTIYNMGIALAGLFLVFAIVRGGFTLMFTDSVLGKLEGKKIILQAMGGAVIVFSSYLLMNTINPQLAQDLNLSLKFPRVKIEKFVSELELVPHYDALQAQARTNVDAMIKKYAGGARDHAKMRTDAKTIRDTVEAAVKARGEGAKYTPEEALKLEEARELEARAEVLAEVSASKYLVDTKLKGALEAIRKGYLARTTTTPVSQDTAKEYQQQITRLIQERYSALKAVDPAGAEEFKQEAEKSIATIALQIHYKEKGCGEDGKIVTGMSRSGTQIYGPCPP